VIPNWTAARDQQRLIQRHPPETPPGEAFNNIYYRHPASLAARPGPPTAVTCPSRATTLRRR
jgi:hypothetical protein